MNTLVILNGPPRSGKDSIAEALRYEHVEFKEALIDMALVMSGICRIRWMERYEAPIWNLDNTIMGWMKDRPWDLLGGLSQRDFLIKVSEGWAKPTFGKGVFGHRAIDEWDSLYDDGTVCVASDGGFPDEVNVFLYDLYWQVIIVRLHRDGCTFEGDSRNYLYDLCENEIDVYNNGYILDAVKEISSYIEGIINKGEIRHEEE